MIDWDKFNRILEGLPFKLTDEQHDFLVKFISGTGHHCVIGDAGVGKTTIMLVLKRYYDQELVACGTTGVSAVNLPEEMGIGTAHSMFNMPRDIAIESDWKKRPHDVLSTTDLIKIIVVDEVFNHSAQELAFYLHQVNKMNRGTRKRKPRDIRLLLVGDPMQNIPITTDEQKKLYTELYGSYFMFDTKLWGQANIKTYVLTQVKRQTGEEPKDVWFRKALQVVRFGLKDHYEVVCKGFNRKWVGDNHSDGAVYIAPTNAMVNTYNDRYLSRNKNPKMTFEVEFDKKYNKKVFPMEWEVTLAVGCKVITLVNNPEFGYQNGTVLTITQMSSDGIFGVKDSGEEIFVPIHEFKEDEVYVSDENKDGVVRQIQKRRHVASAYMLPVKLCAAFSCNRVQGRTFNFETLVDFGSDRQAWLYDKEGMEDFMTGGAFVALSRPTNIDHLKLKNKIYPHHIKVCETSKRFWFKSLEEMKMYE